MTKSKVLAMFAAAVLLLGMTGCTIEDNPSSGDQSVLEQSLVGLWWDEYEYADVTETGIPFSRVLLAVEAKADHTGCIYLGAFDDNSDYPLAVYGGPEEAGFTWRLLADGTVLLSDPVTGETYAMARTRGDGGSYGKDMTDVASTNVTYTGGDNLTVTNDDYSGTLTKADAAKETDIKEKLQAVSTPGDGTTTGTPLALEALTGNYTAKDGDVLSGTLGGNYKITIADGATVTLNGVTINGPNTGYYHAGITCAGNATIVLEGENTVKGFHENYPGIFAAVGKTLTIQGTGSLAASSNGYGAGIGGGYDISCGNIVVKGGTITATGGREAAGIGGGLKDESNTSCGDISIEGGTVNATGGENAAGIGSGTGSCGNITISGGTVTASGGRKAAGIGSGSYANCGNINITDGVTSVTATKGEGAPNSIGAGGDNGTCGTVSITASSGKVIQN